MEPLESIIKRLPPHLQQAIGFIQLLITNRMHKKTYLKLDWAGALSEYKDKYTSLNLQKKALEWWDDEDVSG